MFCCVEAVPHCSSDGQVVIYVEGDDLVVRIDGIVRDGVDLQRVNDRVEALAGSLHHEARAGNGVLSLRVPIDRVPQAQPA